MRHFPFWLLAIGYWLSLAPSHAGIGIIGSKHDLSASSGNAIQAAGETEVCIFCHTPHRAGVTPLWNHAASAATYTPYSSSTLKATVGQPTGSSKLCLSCHDGTVALGLVNSRPTAIPMQNNISTMPSGSSLIGTDLADDHPVSFTYDAALTTQNGQLKDPATLDRRIHLDHDSQVQCSACHDAHDDRYGKFLVMDNTASALCINCHNMTGWQNSSHRLSTATWNGSGVNPWPHTDKTTVAANACENCHRPHNAGTKQRLLNFPVEEDNCYSCHGGTVAVKNLAAEFNKFSVHPVTTSADIHDPMEDAINSSRHVECADCHNPHAANDSTAPAPDAPGAIAGTVGVTTSGTLISPIVREYELCFRCHADSINRGPARVNRQFVQTNTRLEFNTASSSYHPVTTAGKNPNVPSLLAPWTISSLVKCTDCHNNDQGPGNSGVGPKGPHGSTYTPLLERNLLLTDNSPESAANYDLCYKCHSRAVVTSEQITSWSYHKLHVVDKQTACTTCHDPHGVPNATHLINFNRNYVTPSSNGRLEFVDQGINRGNCSLTCHGKDHDQTGYPTLSAPAALKSLRGLRK